MNKITVKTNHPVAIYSPDHLFPHGTMRDNSSNPEFNKKLYELFPVKEVRLLDIGCSGGGLVKSILDDGGFAVGIEGSDYSKNLKRAEWATIPNNLFTADVTKFFSVLECYFPSYFNVITAWEVMEHFKEEDIQAVIRNIKSHLDIHDKSFFIGSIAAIPDGIWHQTVKDKQWWIDKFNLCGMKQAPDLEEHFHNARVRFEGNLVAMRLKK